MTDRYREHPVVTCHLMDGQLVPVHAEEEPDETVWFALPPEPDASRVWEGLRARRGEHGETAQIRVRIAQPRVARIRVASRSIDPQANGKLFAVDLKSERSAAVRLSLTFRVPVHAGRSS